MAKVKQGLSHHTKSIVKTLFDSLSYRPTSFIIDDLEIRAVSVMHNTPNQSVEETLTCPVMLLIICLEGCYKVHFCHPDRITQEYIIRLKQGQCYALTGNALKVWMHQPKFTEEGGRTIIRVGYRTKDKPDVVTVEDVDTTAWLRRSEGNKAKRQTDRAEITKEKMDRLCI